MSARPAGSRSAFALSQTDFDGLATEPCHRSEGLPTVILKGFSYAMIGVFACGLAFTFVGSASQLLRL
ncbi:hypothetical protein MOTC310_26410 [Methylobacterium oryzae]|uniref:Uncharacterized protein n=1 Tax=Methylobacterium oryzae TaxID=334852 RepID=A0ABU7TV89_9HYPH